MDGYGNALNLMIARGFEPTADYNTSMANALALKAKELDLQMAPERMAMEREKMGMQRQQMRWLEDDRLMEVMNRPLKDMKEAVSLLHDVIPTVSFEQYPSFYEHMQKVNGMGKFLPLPTPESVAQKGPQGWEKSKMEFYSPEVQARFLELANKPYSPKTREEALGNEAAKAEFKASASAKYREPKEPPEAKSKTEDQRIADALRVELGREPTDREVLDEKTKRQQANAPNIYIGTNEEGTPLAMKSRGTPTVTPAQVPEGTKVQPKPAHMPNEMVVAEQQISTLETTLSRVDSNYDPAYVGPLAGRLGAMQEQWTGIPEKQAMFYADLAQINNSLVYLMSGKQINEQEYKRLLKQLPVATLPEGVFKSRMKTFKATLESILEERHKNMKSRGVGTTPGKKDVSKMTDAELLEALGK